MPARHALLIGINRYPNIFGADLRGAVNDTTQIFSLLTTRFGFRAEEIVTLCNEAASRDAIRTEMAAITARVGKADLVVLFFAGHGSRIENAGTQHPAVESIVPADSGRESMPNRDILDFEIDQWVQLLNRATPYVTLIMDCCHSGSVTRDPFSEFVRAAPTDSQSLGAWATTVGSDLPQENEDERAHIGTAAWVAGRRQAVVLAACQAREFAWEHRWWDGTDVQYGGAFTFFLRETIAAAPPDSTWRSIFEPLMASLAREYPRQHPIAEGKVDEHLLGRSQLLPAPYLPVLESRDNEVTLGGGLAHGVHLGSRWEVRSRSTEREDQTTESSPDRFTLKVTEIKPTRSVACCESGPATPLSAGQRARLIEDVVDTALVLQTPANDDFAVRQLIELVRQEPLLSISSGQRTAEIRIRRVPARRTVREGDPYPHLGPLDRPQWAAIGRGGNLVTRLQPEQGDVAKVLSRLVGDLLLVARFRNILAIENPNLECPFHHQLHLRVKRLLPTAEARRTETSNAKLAEFREGDHADFEITNEGDTEVYFTLLEFGTDFQIKPLAPYSGHPTYRVSPEAGGVALAPGDTFSVRDYYANDPSLTDHVREGLRLHLPDGFPWAAENPQDSLGMIYLKLFVTTAPTDFGFLLQQGARPTEHVIPKHPLAQLLAHCAWGHGTRSFAPIPTRPGQQIDWSTESLVVGVRR